MKKNSKVYKKPDQIGIDNEGLKIKFGIIKELLRYPIPTLKVVLSDIKEK